MSNPFVSTHENSLYSCGLIASFHLPHSYKALSFFTVPEQVLQNNVTVTEQTIRPTPTLKDVLFFSQQEYHLPQSLDKEDKNSAMDNIWL